MKTAFLAAALLATGMSGQAFAEGCMYAKPADTAQISKPDTTPMISKSTGEGAATTIAAAPVPAPEAASTAAAKAEPTAVREPATIAASSITPSVKPN